MSVTGLQVAENGKLISYSDDTSIKIWNINEGTCLTTLKGHSECVNAIKCNQNHTHFITVLYLKQNCSFT